MDNLLLVLQLILPIVIMVGFGLYCRKKDVLSAEILGGLKRLVMNYFLPVMIFSAMMETVFSPTLLLMVALSLAMNAAGLGFGWLTQRFLGKYKTYHPFLLSGYEVGFLGYPLFPLLFGAGSLGFLASMDAGNCIFFFCIYLPIMQSRTGGSGISAKQTLKNIFREPCLVACLLGLLLSALGLGHLLLDSAAGAIIERTFSMITSPMTALILIIVGYNLNISKESILPVLKTSGLRIAVNGVLCTLGILLLKHIGIKDSLAVYSLVFMCALSSPYAITVFAKGEENLAYISTQVSLYSIVTFAVFIVLQLMI